MLDDDDDPACLECDSISSTFHCEVWVLSGGGLCYGPIVRLEECGVCVCSRNLNNEEV